MRRFALAISTWFGCGYFPWGPGTVGSAAAVAMAIVAHVYCGAGHTTLLIATALLLFPGIWASTRTARILERSDPGLVVVDEVLGQWLTLAGATALNWKSFFAGFLLFRLLDIWKPWPLRKLERLPEGIGIVADDLGAGIYGALILYIGGSLRLY